MSKTCIRNRSESVGFVVNIYLQAIDSYDPGDSKTLKKSKLYLKRISSKRRSTTRHLDSPYVKVIIQNYSRRIMLIITYDHYRCQLNEWQLHRRIGEFPKQVFFVQFNYIGLC